MVVVTISVIVMMTIVLLLQRHSKTKKVRTNITVNIHNSQMATIVGPHASRGTNLKQKLKISV